VVGEDIDTDRDPGADRGGRGPDEVVPIDSPRTMIVSSP
jgi:hypothetical protein